VKFVEPCISSHFCAKSERFRLRWFGHVTRMPHERQARQVLLAAPTGQRLRGRPRSKWSDYISDMAWSRPCVEWAELSKITKNLRDVSTPPRAAAESRSSSEKKRVWKWLNESHARPSEKGKRLGSEVLVYDQSRVLYARPRTCYVWRPSQILSTVFFRYLAIMKKKEIMLLLPLTKFSEVNLWYKR